MTNNIDKKVLIVEDDEDFVFILEKKFTTVGFSVVTAKNGQDAIVAVDKEKPDLILSDMLMPKMDGITMLAKIRETNKTIPVIFLTNTNVQDNEENKKALKFDYLIKSNTKMDDIVSEVKKKLGI